MNNCTATIVADQTELDIYGNPNDDAPTTRQLSWALIAPRSSDERTDPSVPAVITAATLYGPFDEAPAFVDTVTVANHSAALDGTWRVEGFPGPWSLDGWKPGFEVALKRASVDA